MRRCQGDGVSDVKPYALGVSPAGVEFSDGEIVPHGLAHDAPAMLALLRDYEWSGTTDHGAASCCEECGADGSKSYPGRHDPTCTWGALLDKHGRDP